VGILERAGRGPLVVAALVVVGLAAAGVSMWWHARPVASGAGARPAPGEHDHLVVEVLNTTQAIGLARAATRVLRDAGIDVVFFGSDTGAALDSTQVLVRRGPPGRAAVVAQALGVGAVRQLPDPGRLVDVTVRLGRDFAAHLVARDP
jgi:uncharacterized iron-regulated membrane protein